MIWWLLPSLLCTIRLCDDSIKQQALQGDNLGLTHQLLNGDRSLLITVHTSFSTGIGTTIFYVSLLIDMNRG